MIRASLAANFGGTGGGPSLQSMARAYFGGHSSYFDSHLVNGRRGSIADLITNLNERQLFPKADAQLCSANVG